MFDYRNEKPIEKLDPIPEGWTNEDKTRFLEHGFLAFAGETPAGVMRTKKVSLEILANNMPGVVVWTGNGQSRTSDGTFTLVETGSSETGKPEGKRSLVLNNGALRAAGGWYHVQATARIAVVAGNVPYRNEYRNVSVKLSVEGTDIEEISVAIDMSTDSCEYRTVSSVVYIADDDSSVTFSAVGLGQDNLVTARLDNVSVHKLESPAVPEEVEPGL